MNSVIQQILKLFDQLSDDERLHVLDEIDDRYGLIGNNGSTKESDKILIRLTRGAIEQQYIRLTEHFDFFPQDVFGDDDPAPKQLKLHVYGYSQLIETDILRNYKRFRTRRLKELFKDCKVNSFIVIERLSDYEYKIYPLM